MRIARLGFSKEEREWQRTAAAIRAEEGLIEERLRVLESPWMGLVGGVVLGSQEFVEELRQRMTGKRREQSVMKEF